MIIIIVVVVVDKLSEYIQENLLGHR
jgi:hypothetical protein